MQLAIDKAREGLRKGQTPFGACLVLKGEVLAVAHNAVWETCDITAHAEIRAIRQACARVKRIHLTQAVMYSTCEPCPMCFSACHWARINKIVYGTSIRDAASAGFNELNVSNKRIIRLGELKIQSIGGCLKEENKALFQDWRLRKDRRGY